MNRFDIFKAWLRSQSDSIRQSVRIDFSRKIRNLAIAVALVGFACFSSSARAIALLGCLKQAKPTNA